MNIIPYTCEDSFDPIKAYADTSAAYDLKAYEVSLDHLHTYHAYEITPDKLCELSPGGRALVKTSVKINIPENMVGLVCPRSGLALKYGITILNAPGVIDSGYLGDVGVILCNLGAQIFTIYKGDTVGQLLIISNGLTNLLRKDSLDVNTIRGSNGFGSSTNPNKYQPFAE